MQVRNWARGRVPQLTTLLTLVSLALVFGAALRVIPESVLPRASDATLSLVPHLNAALSTAAIVTILLGWRFARGGDYGKHRAMMLASLGLFATFLALYLYKVTLEGPTSFPGPAVVETYVYLPLLAVHVLLAMVCIPLLYYVLLLAMTRPIAALPESRHRRVGRIAAPLWLASFALGNVVYLLLYVLY